MRGASIARRPVRKLAEFKMVAYARIAGFDYYLKKNAGGVDSQDVGGRAKWLTGT